MSKPSILPLHFSSAPLYALRTYLIQRPRDIFALHLLSLLLERDHQLQSALNILYDLSSILEQQYEDNEDPETLQKFCIVKSDIGRLSLGLGLFEDAVDNSSTSLDLSQEIEGLVRTRLSSHITVGLGYYFMGRMEESLSIFQSVLAESDEDVDAMLLVSRVLWATGGEQERNVAVRQLHDMYHCFAVIN